MPQLPPGAMDALAKGQMPPGMPSEMPKLPPQMPNFGPGGPKLPGFPGLGGPKLPGGLPPGFPFGGKKK